VFEDDLYHSIDFCISKVPHFSHHFDQICSSSISSFSLPFLPQGLTLLLHGPPGTGKTLVAEAIGYEVGKPLKVVNCGELLSKWVGESSKNIDAIFQEARHQDAILVFDEAEGLFGQRTTMRYIHLKSGSYTTV